MPHMSAPVIESYEVLNYLKGLFMKLYPYQTIQTVNLPTLLFAARALGIFAYIFSFFTVLLWGVAFAVDPRVRETCLFVSIGTFSATICFLVISGLCAAVVSCEQKYTQG